MYNVLNNIFLPSTKCMWCDYDAYLQITNPQFPTIVIYQKTVVHYIVSTVYNNWNINHYVYYICWCVIIPNYNGYIDG